MNDVTKRLWAAGAFGCIVGVGVSAEFVGYKISEVVSERNVLELTCLRDHGRLPNGRESRHEYRVDLNTDRIERTWYFARVAQSTETLLVSSQSEFDIAADRTAVLDGKKGHFRIMFDRYAGTVTQNFYPDGEEPRYGDVSYDCRKEGPVF